MITICIPTMDRLDFLKALLNFYELRSRDYYIFIGDSSGSKTHKKIQKLVSELANSDHIRLFHCEGMGVIETVSLLASKVETPYSVMNPDDDFFLLDFFPTLLSTLENQKGAYVGVNGLAVLYEHQKKELYHYPMRGLYHGTASQRLLFLAGNYFGLLFSIFKTEIFQEIYDASRLSDVALNQAVNTELLQAFGAAISGRVLHFKTPFLVRMVGHERQVLETRLDETVAYQLTKGALLPALQASEGFHDIRKHELELKRAWQTYCATSKSEQKFSLKVKIRNFFERIYFFLIRLWISRPSSVFKFWIKQIKITGVCDTALGEKTKV